MDRKEEQARDEAIPLPICPGREIAEEKYLRFINMLVRGRQRLRGIRSAGKELCAVEDEFHRALNAQITDTKREMRDTLDEMPWDKLVIAFFGETNAGKSTLIETFRILFEQNRPKGRDGLIVGDGRQDFTRERSEYEMEIDGRPFVLIDAPGIEGNEEEVRGEIVNSLKKVHCVFCVQGENNKPNDETAKKIREYLSARTNAYSVQNVCGSVDAYNREHNRKTLLSDNVLKIGEEIKAVLKDKLGPDAYKGNVPVQGLIALCAKADFADERQDLKKTQDKLVGHFGSAEAMWEFSRAQALVDLVSEWSKPENFTDELVAASDRKIKKLMQDACASVEKLQEENKDKLAKIRSALREYGKGIKDCVVRATKELRKKANDVVDSEFSKFRGSIYWALENNENVVDTAKRAMDSYKYVNKGIKGACTKVVEECLSRIRESREKVLTAKDLQTIVGKPLPEYAGTEMFDFSEAAAAVEEKRPGWWRELIPLSGYNRRKADARRAATNFLGKARAEALGLAGHSVAEFCGELKTWVEGLRREIDAERRNLDEVEATMREHKKDILIFGAEA